MILHQLIALIMCVWAVHPVLGQDACTSNGGQPDWSYLSGINTYEDVKNNVDMVISRYANCPLAAANQANIAGMNCTEQDVLDVLCLAGTMDVMIKWSRPTPSLVLIEFILGQCIPESERCAYYTRAIQEKHMCFMDEIEENIELYIDVCATSYYHAVYNKPLPMEMLLFAPEYIMMSYVESLDTAKLAQLLDEVIQKPYIFELFRCRVKKDFMDHLEQTGVGENKLIEIQTIITKHLGGLSLNQAEEDSLATFFKFMPYYSTGVCTLIIDYVSTYFLDQTNNYIKNVDFCSAEDSMLYNISHSSSDSLSFFAAASNITRESMDFLYNNARFEDDEDCYTDCVGLFVDKALNYISLNVNNISTTLGNLADCLSPDQQASFMNDLIPGECGDELFSTLTTNAQNNPLQNKELRDKCIPSDDPTTKTAADIVKMGCWSLCEATDYSVRLNTTELCTAMGTIQGWTCFDTSECQSPDIADYVLQNCQSTPNYNALKQKLFMYLTIDEIVTFLTNNPSFDTILEQLELFLTENTFETVILKYYGTQNVNSLSLSTIPATAMASMAQDTFDTLLSSSGAEDIINVLGQIVESLPPEKAAVPLKKLLEGTINASFVSTIPPALFNGMTIADLAKIGQCSTGASRCVINLAKKRTVGRWTGIKASKLSELLLSALKSLSGGSNDFSQVMLAADFKNLDGACLRNFDSTHFSFLNDQNAVKAIALQLAKDKRRVCEIPKADRQSKAEAIFQKLGVDPTSSSASWTDAEKDWASLLLGLDNVAAQFSTAFFTNGGAANLAKCPFEIPDTTLRNSMIQGLQLSLAFANPSTWKLDNVGLCWLPYMLSGTTVSSEISAIKKLISQNVNYLHKILQDADFLQEFECLKLEVDESTRSGMESSWQALLDAVNDAASVNAALFSGRRRRSTITSCTTIQTILPVSLPSTLTLANINSMADSEIASCLSYLGQATGWASDQSLAILNKAATNNGWTDYSTLTAQNTITMGTIAYAFTTTDIGVLNLNNEMMGQLGILHEWSTDQVTAIASRYLSLSSLTPATLTSTEIQLLMHGVCGLNTVSQVSPAQYKLAASTLGSLNAATPIACLQSLAALAVHSSAYGDASTWTSTIYSTVGTVAVGLSGAQLNTADQDSIDALGTLISSIPASEMAQLSTTVLGYFNRQQALAVTSTQRAAMSAEQLNVIDSITQVTYTSSSTACEWFVSMTLLMISVLVTCSKV